MSDKQEFTEAPEGASLERFTDEEVALIGTLAMRFRRTGVVSWHGGFVRLSSVVGAEYVQAHRSETLLFVAGWRATPVHTHDLGEGVTAAMFFRAVGLALDNLAAALHGGASW